MAQRGPAKRFLDIEQALRWAYRDELPKRQTGRGSWIAGTCLSPVDRTVDHAPAETLRHAANDREDAMREPGYPAAAGEPHADALAIEAAVKALAAWNGHSFGPAPSVGDPAGLMHGFDLMAWRGHIDHVQIGLEAVAAMPGIVAVHARAGTRPRWSRQTPEPFPEDRGRNGKPKVLIDEIFVETIDRRGRRRYEPTDEPLPPGAISYTEPVPCTAIRGGLYPAGAYCPLVYRPNPARIVTERAEYAAWRMALELLADDLEGRLASIAPLHAAAPWRPWCFDKGSAGQGEAHGRPPELFKGQRDEPHRRPLTREQEAARRRAALRRQLSDRGEEARPVHTPMAGRRSGEPAA